MKKFIIKLVIFLICFFCLDQIIGFGFKKLHNQVKSGTVYITNYALKQSNDDILIFGASEVNHSINSLQISDSLGLKCYNLAMDGQGIYYHFTLLSELLNRHKPKLVIISTMGLHENKHVTLAPLYPYYTKFQSVRKTIEDIEPTEKYKLFIKGYAYNSLLLNVIQGNILHEPNTNGYTPLYTVAKNMHLDSNPFKIGITERTLQYYEKFILSCLNADCKVYVLDAPRYFSSNDMNENQKIRELLDKYSIEYFNYAADTMFINHPELFKDKTHLNHTGATIFTNLIIEKIKQDM